MVIKLEDVVQSDPCAHGTIRELGYWPDAGFNLYLCMDCDSSLSDGVRGQVFLGNYSPACYLHDKDPSGNMVLRWVYQRKEGL